MSRGAWMPIRTFSPMTDSTETSMSSPIMMLWFDLRVRTNIRGAPPCCRRKPHERAPALRAPVTSAPCTKSRTICSGLRFARLRARMARRSLKPELNKIRAWVRQGRTDAWIAHQLDGHVQQIERFKRDQDLAA